MTGRREFPFVLAGLSAALAWTTARSWSDLVVDPGRFLGPALIGVTLLGLTGALLRSARTRWWLVAPAQLIVVTIWLHHRQGADTAWGGWLPTPSGITNLAEQVRLGAQEVNTYSAPVGTEHALAPVYLLVAAIAVAFAVDLIGCGLRRAPWTGLPVLIALTVPISVLDTPVPWTVLAAAALLFLAVIGYAESAEIAAWGHGTTTVRHDPHTARLRALGPATGIAVVTTLGALTLPGLLPLGAGVFDVSGSGSGSGGSGTITLTNPLVDLRRDLQREEQVPLVDATTDSSDPSYLRLAVLDTYSGGAWVPSVRELPASNRASGPVPAPSGVAASPLDQRSTWQLATTSAFRTTWLPVPSGIRSIVVDKGDWRYDRSTLDITSVDRPVPTNVSYEVDAVAPALSAADLDAATRLPASLRELFTNVPEVDPELVAISKRVTASGRTDYQKAVLLQDWFRTDGGFTYSLDPGPGSGMEQLVRFVSSDKVGYCEQFAAAMAVMARTLDIPARVVVGFLRPEQVSLGVFRYSSSDLHAWPEIYFSGHGWVRFEPTPSSRTNTAPPWTRNEVVAPAAPTPSAAPTSAPGQQPELQDEEPAPTPITQTTTSSRTPITLVALGAAVLLLGVPRLVRRSQRQRRLHPRSDPRATVEALWSELHARATDLGLRWPAGRSAREIAAALIATAAATPADSRQLETLVDLLERARYAPRFSLTGPEHAAALATLEAWSSLLGSCVSARRARSARWFPASVLRRGIADPPAPAFADERGRDAVSQ